MTTRERKGYDARGMVNQARKKLVESLEAAQKHLSDALGHMGVAFGTGARNINDFRRIDTMIVWCGSIIANTRGDAVVRRPESKR